MGWGGVLVSFKVCSQFSQLVWSRSASAPHTERRTWPPPPPPTLESAIKKKKEKKLCQTLKPGNYLKKKKERKEKGKRKKDQLLFWRVIIESGVAADCFIDSVHDALNLRALLRSEAFVVSQDTLIYTMRRDE